MKRWLMIASPLFVVVLACASFGAGRPEVPPPKPPETTTQPSPPQPPPEAVSTPPPASPGTTVSAMTDCRAGDANRQSPLYEHYVYYALSSDALHFKPQPGPVLEHASVPDGVIGPDGRVWVYFINGQPGRHGIFAARQTDNGMWEIIDCVRLDGQFEGNAVDPDITRLPDGRYRLVYFLGYFVGDSRPKANQPHPIYSAISDDGLNFTIEQELIAVENVTDPSLVQLPDGSWLLALAQPQQERTLLATSQDGNNFELTGVVIERRGIPELAVLPDGRVRLFLDQSLISEDGGQTWTVETGSRIPGGGADPSLVALPDGSYVFIYKQITPK